MCPLCKSNEHSIIGKPQVDDKARRMLRKDYHIVQCNNCKFYYVEPLIDLNDEEWKILYDEEYFGGYTKWHLKRRARDRIQRINKLQNFTNHKVERFLDVGCGEGYMLLEAYNKGWKAVGLDITDNRINEARSESIKFIRSDLLTAQLPENHFDCIYLDSIVEHVLNPVEYLTETKRILKPGGVAYIGVPNEDCLQNDVRKILYKLTWKSDISSKIKPFSSPYHVSGFNKYSLSFLIKKSGLKIELLKNFATKSVFRMTRFTSKDFLPAILLTMINLIAFVIRREYYLETYIKKK